MAANNTRAARSYHFCLPATIAEDQIAPLAAVKGSTNAEAVVLDGQQFAPGTLVWRGFAGAINLDTGHYDGHARYDRRRAGEAATAVSFAGAPGATIVGQEPPAAEIEEAATEQPLETAAEHKPTLDIDGNVVE
ncbi:MAG TPA: hypothetical protein VGG64_29910 [Pirellulales bacterium]|jgi:hypothetical protein